ncbi:MAG: ASCH domain-containing protein [Clostridiales bacterium]|nr:ASCH domain-containing protein [Clostridiales bacterium]
MEHKMNLNPEPFEKIKEGKKTIELRLYDEKRKLISVGDKIKFFNICNKNEVLTAKVVELHIFKNFEALYRELPLLKCGYSIDNVEYAKASDMDFYYPPDRQKKYGVVGIEICLL